MVFCRGQDRGGLPRVGPPASAPLVCLRYGTRGIAAAWAGSWQGRPGFTRGGPGKSIGFHVRIEAQTTLLAICVYQGFGDEKRHRDCNLVRDTRMALRDMPVCVSQPVSVRDHVSGPAPAVKVRTATRTVPGFHPVRRARCTKKKKIGTEKIPTLPRLFP